MKLIEETQLKEILMHVEEEIFQLRRKVRQLEEQVEILMRKLNLKYDKREDEIPPEVYDWLLQGKKIEAVKAYREATGASLKTAKEVIESLGLQ